jgi:X-Pro dipeptidyl-peptidase-like protein
MRPGGFDQREAPGFHGCRAPYLPLGSRPDVLVFQTEPLREPTEVTGPIEVHLGGAASAADTDFTAKLIDVYPPSAWYPQGYPNTGEAIGRERRRVVADNTVFHERGRESRVVLPIIPDGGVLRPLRRPARLTHEALVVHRRLALFPLLHRGALLAALRTLANILLRRVPHARPAALTPDR